MKVRNHKYSRPKKPEAQRTERAHKKNDLSDALQCSFPESPRVLQLTTYHIDLPDHGGKLRAYHLRQSLRRFCTVETLAFDWGVRERLAGFNVVLRQKFLAAFHSGHLLGDLLICAYLDKEKPLKTRIAENVRIFDPDIVWLEQPFLWPLVKKLRVAGSVRASAMIVYSSQNNETAMKRDIYSAALPENLKNKYLGQVANIEKEIVANSQGAIAVSAADAGYLKSLSRSLEVHIVPNGSTAPQQNRKVPKWRRKFSKYSKNYVFVGSYHPPNINGIRRLVNALSERRASRSIGLWVLGGAGLALLVENDSTIDRLEHVNICGLCEADDIDAAIVAATGVVLPIWEGGGSNLKTAQALLSDRAVIGTNFAFRGFELYKSQHGVYCADSPNELVDLMLKLHVKKSYTRSHAVRALEWTHITASVPKIISRIVNYNQSN